MRARDPGHWARSLGADSADGAERADSRPGPEPDTHAPGEGVPRGGQVGAQDGAGGKGGAPRRGKPRHRKPAAPGKPTTLVDLAKEFVLVVGMAIVLSTLAKTFLVQAFFIPSGSMESTLIPDDRVLVNKLVPEVVDIQRGDIVVFEDPDHWLEEVQQPSQGVVLDAVNAAAVFVGLKPNDSNDHLIKRVIGLPGDEVACCTEGRVTVNGVRLDEPYVMPGDVPSLKSFSITVPEGRVWVMGDHRSDSADSREHDPDGTGSQGSVPIEKITGRAFAVVWPYEHFGGLSAHEETFSRVPRTAPAPTVSPTVPSSGP